MYTTEQALDIFSTCTGLSKQILQKWELPEEIQNSLVPHIVNSYDFDAFNRMLIKYNMDEFSANLFNFINKRINNQYPFLDFKVTEKSFFDKIRTKRKDNEDLARLLFDLLSLENGKIKSLAFQQEKGVTTIANDNIIQVIILGLIGEFEARENNWDNLTLDEAEEEIKNGTDTEWIRDWIESHEFCTQDGERIFEFELYENDLQYYDSSTGDTYGIDHIRKKMISDYSEGHFMRRDITVDFLEKVIQNDYSSKGEKGAPEKNKSLKFLTLQLADLKKAVRFINAKVENVDFEKFTLKNEDCRFIFDCLEIFGLIDSQIKSPTEKYIREILKQATKNNKSADLLIKYRNAKFYSLKQRINSINCQ
jgi:hypothetical protein